MLRTLRADAVSRCRRVPQLASFCKNTLITLQEQDDFSDEECSNDELEEIAAKFNIRIPKVLQTILENDYYSIKEEKKLIQLPCSPDVVDILEEYLKHYAAELTAKTTKPARCSFLRQPPVDLSQVEARFALCKEAMDGLRVTFSHILLNSLLYNEEKHQHQLVTTFCRAIRICRMAAGNEANELNSQSEASPLNTASDMASTAECSPTKCLQDTSDPKGSLPPQRERSASPPEKPLCLSKLCTLHAKSPEKPSENSSNRDHVPLEVAAVGKKVQSI
ncbi:hypothetical protein V5799_003758 [Amblyomma americanum]|uniref:MRG domain-containing protein n=1 Tax=Amblyomma americanum TaxID=6943 RepID=A0AAQ4D821_AMBAM